MGYHGETFNGALNLNEYNHNENGNPHPQYDSFLTYETNSNKTTEERFVKIFEGNFQDSPNNVPETSREFQKLIYGFHTYDMNSAERPQGITNVCLYAFADNNGLGVDINVDYSLSSSKKPKFVLFYKKIKESTIESSYNEYKVVLYGSANSYNRIRINPYIYDTISNYVCKYNLKAAKYGCNTKQSMDDLYKDLYSEPFLTEKEMIDKYVNYGIISKNNETINSLSIKNGLGININVKNIEIVKMGNLVKTKIATTTGQTMKQELIIYAAGGVGVDSNEYIDRTSSNTMFITKENTDIQIPNGRMIIFKWIENKWHEIGRDF